MLAEGGSIIFYGQKFSGIDLPDVGVSEETRLRAAPIGVYELWFRQQPQYQFSGVFLLNDASPDPQPSEQQKQFEVSEIMAANERTLTIRRTTESINLKSIEIVPLDWRENPVEFTPVEISETQRTINYRSEAPVESLKLKFSGMDVFDVASINTVLWTNAGRCSRGTLTAFIRRSEDIRIDRLDNPEGGTRRIEEHLQAFFQILLGTAPERTFDLECSYRYPVAADGPNVHVPVVFQQTANLPTASELFSSLLPHLRTWYQSASPPEGVFVFGVRVYGSQMQQSVPPLYLTSLVLPIESIAGWSEQQAF